MLRRAASARGAAIWSVRASQAWRLRALRHPHGPQPPFGTKQPCCGTTRWNVADCGTEGASHDARRAKPSAHDRVADAACQRPLGSCQRWERQRRLPSQNWGYMRWAGIGAMVSTLLRNIRRVAETFLLNVPSVGVYCYSWRNAQSSVIP
jgi:hypothetical protein